jgi:predicted deacylase
VLAVTAGIHAGEYVPMVAARQFVRGLDSAAMPAVHGEVVGAAEPVVVHTQAMPATLVSKDW